jgi:anaerobic ribonucleoside-triphosphate reductase activating protein
MIVRLHAIEHASRANGPGLRAVVWFQGCTLICPGCFNPGTHDANAGYVTETAALAAEILARKDALEGLSISGGEPFQQPEALLDLLQRFDGSPLSRLVFSGYTLEEIKRQPLGPQILSHIDVLIAGRYAAAQHRGFGLLGSVNQKIHLLTSRYTQAALVVVPRRELILHADGSTTSTGIAPWRPA